MKSVRVSISVGIIITSLIPVKGQQNQCVTHTSLLIGIKIATKYNLEVLLQSLESVKVEICSFQIEWK